MWAVDHELAKDIAAELHKLELRTSTRATRRCASSSTKATAPYEVQARKPGVVSSAATTTNTAGIRGPRQSDLHAQAQDRTEAAAPARSTAGAIQWLLELVELRLYQKPPRGTALAFTEIAELFGAVTPARGPPRVMHLVESQSFERTIDNTRRRRA